MKRWLGCISWFRCKLMPRSTAPWCLACKTCMAYARHVSSQGSTNLSACGAGCDHEASACATYMLLCNLGTWDSASNACPHVVRVLHTKPCTIVANVLRSALVRAHESCNKQCAATASLKVCWRLACNKREALTLPANRIGGCIRCHGSRVLSACHTEYRSKCKGS